LDVESYWVHFLFSGTMLVKEALRYCPRTCLY